VATLAPLLLCGAGVWALDGRATALFVAPGAAGVLVQRASLAERVIAYSMPNPDDGWQTAIARRLSASGWSISTDFYQWGDTEKFRPIYQRVTRIWLWRLCERAELLGDRAHALVRVRYRFPCP
jgi:hypothetical protein